MHYDFRSLLPADFEDLARDLAGTALGIRFEGFGPGPDGGVDGRHSSGGKTVILQAKHFASSSFGRLKSEMRKERIAIDRLKPDRYVLVTSRSLSCGNKAELAAIIGPSLREESDILGPDDLNELIRKHPEIEQAHVKLWISSSGVLDRIVNAGAHAFNALTKEEIAAKFLVYVQNPSLAEARNILEQQHVLIISGPPGVGKTTLAEILAYAYMADGWQLTALRTLEDGFAAIRDPVKQVFFFDDFLGTIALDAQALAGTDSALAKFLVRVRGSPNARFILTTRAYILNDAQRRSEHLSHRRVEIAKYVLDVGSYTRAIRARILYNHIVVAGTPIEYVSSLVSSGRIPAIVDHKNYNPRIVEWMTDEVHLRDIETGAYAGAFLSMLDNPSRLWDVAFRTHISAAAQHLLITLFFSSDFGVTIETLRLAYNPLHRRFCEHFGIARGPKDFEDNLKLLESGFISIVDAAVLFVNPSVRDYLSTYLQDPMLLRLAAQAASDVRFARNVWNFANSNLRFEEWEAIAQAFVPFAPRLANLPVQRAHWNSLHPNDLPRAVRITLLLEWLECCGDPAFEAAAFHIAASPKEGFDAWHDGDELVRLIEKLGATGLDDDGSPLAASLLGTLVGLLEDGPASDDLESISDAVAKWDKPPAVLTSAVFSAIRQEVSIIHEVVENIDSETTLEEHSQRLEKLAERAGVPTADVQYAKSRIGDRMAELDDARTETAEPPALPSSASHPLRFTDEELASLFRTLVVQ